MNNWRKVLAWQQQATHQELMDEAYKGFTDSMSNEDFRATLSPKHRDAVILGNLNYQVGNGGFQQWYDNNYGKRDIDYLINTLLPQITTFAGEKVLDILEQVRAIREEYEEITRGMEYEDNEVEHIWRAYDLQDDRYYDIDDQFMEDVQEYLNKLQSESFYE